MYVISFDIGAKNLAYCLLEIDIDLVNKDNIEWYKESKYPLRIADWDVIDICDADDKKSCSYMNCKVKPKYEKENKYYCLKHAKQNKKFSILPKHKKIEKMKLNELEKFYNDIDIQVIDIENDYEKLYNAAYKGLIKHKFNENIETEYDKKNKKPKLKKSDYIEKIKEIMEKKYYNEITKQNAGEVSLVTMGKNMKLKLDKALNSYNIHSVLIENQISPIANRMKTIQGMVAQYFIMNDVNEVEFLSSANKLKDFSNGKKTKYAERKKLGIEVMNTILDKIKVIGDLDLCMSLEDTIKKSIKQSKDKKLNKQNWKEFFNKHSKKDDLADSFLQALWYINNKM